MEWGVFLPSFEKPVPLQGAYDQHKKNVRILSNLLVHDNGGSLGRHVASGRRRKGVCALMRVLIRVHSWELTVRSFKAETGLQNHFVDY
jgi:hypothetical protein